jgi:quercetin dioxygenase-like cupin family protein
MISEPLQEQASLYILGALTPEEERELESQLRGNSELREWVFQLQRTAARMARSVPPSTPPPKLRSTILERIAAETKIPPAPAPTGVPPGLHFHNAAGESGWKALPVPGAFIKILSLEKERGYAVLMGKIEAGAWYPAHVNAGPEDFYILSGDLVVGDRRLGAGDFHHADKGSQHEVNYSEKGCTLLAVLTTDDPLVAFALS